MKVKSHFFTIAAFLFLSIIGSACAAKSTVDTIEQLLEDSTRRDDVNHWCKQQKIARPELRDVWRQIEVCQNAAVANALVNSPWRSEVKAAEPWPKGATSFFAEAALKDGPAENNPYFKQHGWCTVQNALRTKEVTSEDERSEIKPDYRSVSKGCAAAYPVVVLMYRDRREKIVKVNGKILLDAAGQAEREKVEKQAEQAAQAEVQKEWDEWSQKKSFSQGGLTWMPIKISQTWVEANSYCSKSTIKGQSWRLPTIDELKALYDSRTLEIKNAAFPLRRTWSSTPGGSNSHYGVGLDNGSVRSYSDREDIYATCVR